MATIMTACCETGCSECVKPCETCDEYNCRCCPDCAGAGEFLLNPLNVSPGGATERCDACGGTGRAKVVAS